MKSRYGHTLVELLFCLLIAGILLGLAMPSFVTTIERSRETAAVNQLIGALHYARSTAVMERKVVGICAGQGFCADKPHWQGQVLIFNDRNRNGQLDTDEDLLRALQLIDNFDLYWRGFRRTNYLHFKMDGTTPAMNGTFTFCRAGSARKQVVINLSGRVRTHAPSDDAPCS
ncbi:hypothetical protein Pres01_00970 [Metapseudomonas resinovorans]|uniref:GspH/FimT family pseudopilin n=1 Tax=Metapseudomonas resinovorans TaxID=53412 RepID=UPI000984FE4A|nr:GspH/FimT family pseudopilin [Pseudomonas resinovorans]GLZ84046.1 hypothetical protein Pres01_00970 [Pseudomonas resinovorans]